MIAQHAADVIVTDPHQLGGLVPFHNAATMCETAGLPICKHAFADLGVTTIATSHVLATLPSPQLGHQQFLTFLVHDLIADKVEFVDGAIPVPTGPGLGIELDRDALEFYGDIYKQYGEFEGYDRSPRSRRCRRTCRSPTADADVPADRPQVHLQPRTRARSARSAPDETFAVITEDCFTGRYDDPANFNAETAAWVDEHLNGVTGPIAVEGAEPGEAVEVDDRVGRGRRRPGTWSSAAARRCRRPTGGTRRTTSSTSPSTTVRSCSATAGRCRSRR